MEKSEKKKPIAERIADLKKQIVATTDKHLVAKHLDQLLSLQKQADKEPVELIVPTSEVIKKIDMDTCALTKTMRGFLWETKGGLSIFISMRAMSAYQHMSTLFEILDGTYDEENGYDKDAQQGLVQGSAWILNLPLFAFGADILFSDVACAIRDIVLVKGQEYIDNAESRPETDEDERKNIEAENVAQGIQTLIDAPLPPEV